MSQLTMKLENCQLKNMVNIPAALIVGIYALLRRCMEYMYLLHVDVTACIRHYMYYCTFSLTTCSYVNKVYTLHHYMCYNIKSLQSWTIFFHRYECYCLRFLQNICPNLHGLKISTWELIQASFHACLNSSSMGFELAWLLNSHINRSIFEQRNKDFE